MSMIEIKNLSKKYGEFLAVDDLSLAVEKGEIVGFVGKNGAGKSTTMRCMVNMIYPTKGKITINGMDSIKDTKKIKKNLSYMPGEAFVNENAKCIDIFKFSLKFSNESMEKVNALAEFFELDINKKISELSLGNRKKVSIIQCLIKDSEVIILDEPTSGLDPLMQNKFFDVIMGLKEKGVTIFLSSHNLSEIEKYCDKVAIIKGGKLVDFLNMNDIKIKNKQVANYTLKDGTTHQIEIDEDINEIIKKLSTMDLLSLEIKNKTMEDEFTHYYKEEK